MINKWWIDYLMLPIVGGIMSMFWYATFLMQNDKDEDDE